jgi:hypothetical protein
MVSAALGEMGPSDDTPMNCRAQATRFRIKAAASAFFEVRASLLQIAESYERLAVSTEAMDRFNRRLVSPPS